MRKEKVLIIVVLIFLVGHMLGCNVSLPIYEKTDDDGLSVMINGITYKSNPPIKWELNSPGEELGFAGNQDILLLKVSNDTDMNFLYYHDKYASTYGVLYRADKDIPEPSKEVIDKIDWVEYYTESDNNVVMTEDEYTNTINDKEIIEALFNEINNSKKYDIFGYELSSLNRDGWLHIMYIECTSNMLLGAHYKLNIGVYDDKIVCGNSLNKYVEISPELIERISGKKITLKDFLKEVSEP
mgnify:CR=1 FL=1